jgi:hypothetical protein
LGGSSRNLTVSFTALGILLSQLGGPSRTSGRVVRVASGDTVPAGRVPVVLHRVGRTAQGPIDTVRADAGGRFAFRFTADTAAAYLLSVRYDGIEYFSAPIASNPSRPDTAVVILVADTSSTAPVRTRERTLLISRPDESGTRPVVDWLVLQNAGERTRIAPDSGRPSWGTLLPPEAQNVELADVKLSQFSPEALEFRHDSVLLFAPLSPGQKELVLQYHIPGALRNFSVPVGVGTDSVFVLLEEGSARVVRPRLSITDSQRLDGRPFRRWAGVMGDAASLELRFPPAPLSPRLVLLLLVSLLALGFAALAVVTLRRRPLPTTHYPLVDAIARLDAARLEHGGVLSPSEEEQYQAERARLKDALARALADAPPRS